MACGCALDGGFNLDLELLPEHRGRIDLGVIAADFEMQVRAGGDRKSVV